MTDINYITMTDAERASYKNRIDRKRREAALDKAVAELLRFEQEHPGEDTDVVCEVVDAVVERIFAVPLETVGDLRLCARALREAGGEAGFDPELVLRLLNAVETLPSRLFDEPLQPTDTTLGRTTWGKPANRPTEPIADEARP